MPRCRPGGSVSTPTRGRSPGTGKPRPARPASAGGHLPGWPPGTLAQVALEPTGDARPDVPGSLGVVARRRGVVEAPLMLVDVTFVGLAGRSELLFLLLDFVQVHRAAADP